MAKNSSYKFNYDSPIVLTFVLLSVLILTLDTTVFKGELIKNIFTCHGRALDGSFNFDFKNGFEYLKLFAHVFGNSNWEVLLINSVFMLLIGPRLEEKYKSTIIFLIILITAFVSGILAVVFCKGDFTGSSCIVFTFILLASITAFSKKTIDFSWIIAFILYTAYCMVTSINIESKKSFVDFLLNNIHTFTDLAAGCAGAFLGYLVSPKKRTAASGNSNRKASKGKSKKTDSYDEDSYAQTNYSYTQNSTNSSENSSSEETYLGTLN